MAKHVRGEGMEGRTVLKAKGNPLCYL